MVMCVFMWDSIQGDDCGCVHPVGMYIRWVYSIIVCLFIGCVQSVGVFIHWVCPISGCVHPVDVSIHWVGLIIVFFQWVCPISGCVQTSEYHTHVYISFTYLSPYALVSSRLTLCLCLV